MEGVSTIREPKLNKLEQKYNRPSREKEIIGKTFQDKEGNTYIIDDVDYDGEGNILYGLMKLDKGVPGAEKYEAFDNPKHGEGFFSPEEIQALQQARLVIEDKKPTAMNAEQPVNPAEQAAAKTIKAVEQEIDRAGDELALAIMKLHVAKQELEGLASKNFVAKIFHNLTGTEAKLRQHISALEQEIAEWREITGNPETTAPTATAIVQAIEIRSAAAPERMRGVRLPKYAWVVPAIFLTCLPNLDRDIGNGFSDGAQAAAIEEPSEKHIVTPVIEEQPVQPEIIKAAPKTPRIEKKPMPVPETMEKHNFSSAESSVLRVIQEDPQIAQKIAGLCGPNRHYAGQFYQMNPEHFLLAAQSLEKNNYGAPLGDNGQYSPEQVMNALWSASLNHETPRIANGDFSKALTALPSFQDIEQSLKRQARGF